MKPTVENFEILGLFGGKDVKLSFTNKVQIYIGENGLGKTTVLNTLYYLLSLKFEELVNINFSEIKIRINEKNYSFTKTDLQGYVNRNRERNRKSGIYNQFWYLQPIITQYFIDNKSEIWLLFLIAHSKR